MTCLGERRAASLFIQNILPYNVQVVALLRHAPNFFIDKNQFTLKPREVFKITIRLDPIDVDGSLTAELILYSMNQTFIIPIKAFVGQSFQLIDKRIDFGISDIYYDGHSKKVLFRNPYDSKAVVSFKCSSPEIEINGSKPIYLDSHEEKLIKVVLKPNFTGERSESITFFAPFSFQKQLQIHSFSGVQLLIPLLDDLFFSVASGDFPSSLHIPCINTTSSSLQFTVSLPVNAPFSIEVYDSSVANQKNAPQIECKHSENNVSSMYLITLGSFKTAMIEVVFYPIAQESVRVMMDINLVKPRKCYIKTLYLNAFAVNTSWYKEKMDTGFNLDKERRFSRTPMRHPNLKSDYKKGSFDLSKKNNSNVTSTCFQSESTLNVVFGTYLEEKTGVHTYDYVDIFNASDKFQPYHLILSQFFVTDIPLDGGIQSQSFLRIPIRLNRYYFTLGIGISEESQFFTGIGTVNIFDEAGGYISIPLYGIMGDPVAPELRPFTNFIKFPPSDDNERQIRRIYIRNRTPKEILWEGGIGSMESKGLIRKTNSDWCPFSLSANRLVLKPFEYYPLDIIFQSSIKGIVNYKVFMEYRDSIKHGGDHDNMSTDPNRPITSFVIEAGIGSAALDATPSSLFFGNISVGQTVSERFTVSNHGSLDSYALVTKSENFSPKIEDLFIAANNSIENDIYFLHFFHDHIHHEQLRLYE